MTRSRFFLALLLLAAPAWALSPSDAVVANELAPCGGGLSLHSATETAYRLAGDRRADGLTRWGVKNGAPDTMGGFPRQAARRNPSLSLTPIECDHRAAIRLCRLHGPLVIADNGGRHSPYGCAISHATVLVEVSARFVTIADPNYAGTREAFQALTHRQFAERFGGELLIVR